MNTATITILAALLFLCTVPVGSAGVTEMIAIGVETGIIGSCIKIADSILSLSFDGYVDDAKINTTKSIYCIASYTPDPMSSPTVKVCIDYSKNLFKTFYKILILCAAIATIVLHFKTDALQKLSHAMGVNAPGKSNLLMKKGFDGIFVAVLMYVFIYLVLAINDMLTKSVMLAIIDVVSPTPDNVVLYCMMAVAYGFMWLFFSIRTLVIFLFVGFAFVIGLGLLIDFTNEKAVDICAYFVQCVFFQFFIVLYFSACIFIIKEITKQDPSIQAAWYTVMILGGVFLGFKMMWGTGVIRFVGKTALRLVL